MAHLSRAGTTKNAYKKRKNDVITSYFCNSKFTDITQLLQDVHKSSVGRIYWDWGINGIIGRHSLHWLSAVITDSCVCVFSTLHTVKNNFIPKDIVLEVRWCPWHQLPNTQYDVEWFIVPLVIVSTTHTLFVVLKILK